MAGVRTSAGHWRANARPHPDGRGYALVHLFRFERDRIAGLWDVAQALPEQVANEHGMS